MFLLVAGMVGVMVGAVMPLPGRWGTVRRITLHYLRREMRYGRQLDHVTRYSLVISHILVFYIYRNCISFV